MKVDNLEVDEKVLDEGSGRVRNVQRLERRAMLDRWPVSQEAREEAMAAAVRVLRGSSSEVRILGAVKTLIQADLVNVRREANAIAERSADAQAATSALRAALASPGARDALAALSESLCADHQEISVTPALPAPTPDTTPPHVAEK
jgi:hypothetical protein